MGRGGLRSRLTTPATYCADTANPAIRTIRQNCRTNVPRIIVPRVARLIGGLTSNAVRPENYRYERCTSDFSRAHYLERYNIIVRKEINRVSVDRCHRWNVEYENDRTSDYSKKKKNCCARGNFFLQYRCAPSKDEINIVTVHRIGIRLSGMLMKR